MHTAQESEILKRLRHSDAHIKREAFGELVRLYQRQVYSLARKMVINHDDADDVVQETFIKVWKKIDNFKGHSGLYTWIYRIAANEALQFLRKRKRRYLFSGDYEESMTNQLSAEATINGDEIQLRLQKAILKLPTRQRLIFNFKYFEELKYEEIAAITGSSIGTLKANYHHAVKKIEDYLREN